MIIFSIILFAFLAGMAILCKMYPQEEFKILADEPRRRESRPVNMDLSNGISDLTTGAYYSYLQSGQAAAQQASLMAQANYQQQFNLQQQMSQAFDMGNIDHMGVAGVAIGSPLERSYPSRTTWEDLLKEAKESFK